jgi:hypothetical protein
VFSHAELIPIAGTFGEYSFTGTSQLRVTDNLASDQFVVSPYWAAYDLGHYDSWYLTSSVLGPEVNGRALTFLGLYEVLPPETDNSSVFTPQSPAPPLQIDNEFYYIADFSDGIREQGNLETLTLVPEPSSLALLAFGLAGVFAVTIWEFSNLKPRTQL